MKRKRETRREKIREKDENCHLTLLFHYGGSSSALGAAAGSSTGEQAKSEREGAVAPPNGLVSSTMGSVVVGCSLRSYRLQA